MIHYLDVACPDCGAKANYACKRSMGPHKGRAEARDKARAAEMALNLHSTARLVDKGA